jgi:hypothetical protein
VALLYDVVPHIGRIHRRALHASPLSLITSNLVQLYNTNEFSFPSEDHSDNQNSDGYEQREAQGNVVIKALSTSRWVRVQDPMKGIIYINLPNAFYCTGSCGFTHPITEISTTDQNKFSGL